MVERENINISWINQVSKKPEKCIRCENTELRSDVVKVAFGTKNADHVYCSKCETLMVFEV